MESRRVESSRVKSSCPKFSIPSGLEKFKLLPPSQRANARDQKEGRKEPKGAQQSEIEAVGERMNEGSNVTISAFMSFAKV